MRGNDKKKSLSHEEFIHLIDVIESSTSIGELLMSTARELGVKHSLYQHFAAVGALDFTSRGKFHPYEIPEELIEFYETHNAYDSDPIIVASFAKSKFIWLSDTFSEAWDERSGECGHARSNP